MLPPNVGGRAYSTYSLREPVASSTGVPNRVRESTPPEIRSSPVTVGPAFSRSTAIANHEPARTWPWSSARAFIVRPSAADADATGTSEHGGEHRDGGEQDRRCGPGRGGSDGSSGLLDRRRGTGRSIDVPAARKVATPASSLRPVAAPSGGRPTAPIVRCIRPGPDCVVRRAPRPMTSPSPRPEESVPEIRPFRALRFDPEVVGDLGRGRRAAVRRHRRRPRSATLLARAARTTRSASTCPTAEPREDPDERYRRVARTLRRVAVRRHAAQGPPARRLRLRADLPRARHGHRADPARVLRPAAPRAVRARRRRPAPRAHARRPRARTATGCCARRASTRRPSSGSTATRPASRSRRPRRGRADDARSPRSPTTTASATGCGVVDDGADGAVAPR